MKKAILIVMVLILMLFSLVACSGQSDTMTEDKLVIQGVVQEVRPDGSSILVDSESKDAKGLVWVTITGETTYALDVSHEFAVGNYVLIYVDGGIMESDPMQANAAEIISNKFE